MRFQILALQKMFFELDEAKRFKDGLEELYHQIPVSEKNFHKRVETSAINDRANEATFQIN